ncbi:MAG: DinB family protein [Thermoplasmata archaeon]
MVSTIDLMDFVHELRADFFECAAKLGWKEFTKDRAVSMLSFRDVFLHLAYVEEQHVTEFCEGRATPWMKEVMIIPKDKFTTINSVRQRLKEVTALGNRRFRKWNTPKELAQPAVWVASKKYPLKLSRDSALAQCLTEHLLHLGEVEAMLWQMDVEPPTTFWIERRVLHGRWPPPRSALVGGKTPSQIAKGKSRAPSPSHHKR